MKQWVGLDIGGTKCAVLLATVDKGIHITDKVSFSTHTERGFEDTYARLTDAMIQLLQKNNVVWSDIAAIGISCGGPLSAKTGTVLCPPNLPGWVNIPLCKMLTERFHVSAYLQNDANACALVEWKLGAGRGTNDMVFLTMGTGMGAGIIAGGHLLQGACDMAGEVGHLRLSDDGPIGFGKAGSFEGFASGGGIARQAVALTEELIARGTPPTWIKDGHVLSQIDCKLMAQYARIGDAQAIAFFDNIGTHLGEGISLLVDTLNPECVVIGSIFVRCEELLRPAMEATMTRQCVCYSRAAVRVVSAETSESIGDLASIMVALDAMGIDPLTAQNETNPRVLEHFERLFARYPALSCCRAEIMEVYMTLKACYEHGGKVLLAGNGGSCADCEHIVGELMKGFYLKRPLPNAQAIGEVIDQLMPGASKHLQEGLPAIALTGHAALSTAVQNDIDPTLYMAQQVIGYAKESDAFIGISTSGNAQNVALAAAAASALGIKTIAFTGRGGGKLKKLCDCTICVPADTPADVQEYHLPVYHTLCAMLESSFFSI